jgi:hypothetical protein
MVPTASGAGKQVTPTTAGSMPSAHIGSVTPNNPVAEGQGGASFGLNPQQFTNSGTTTSATPSATPASQYQNVWNSPGFSSIMQSINSSGYGNIPGMVNQLGKSLQGVSQLPEWHPLSGGESK